MDTPEGCVRVEVVYALPGEQRIFVVDLPRGATIRAAIERSGVLHRYPELDAGRLTVGIFGERAAMETVVAHGDRIEIYRPLVADPGESRRRRAGKRAGRARA
jgi:uncharacterized protein